MTFLACVLDTLCSSVPSRLSRGRAGENKKRWREERDRDTTRNVERTEVEMRMSKMRDGQEETRGGEEKRGGMRGPIKTSSDAGNTSYLTLATSVSPPWNFFPSRVGLWTPAKQLVPFSSTNGNGWLWAAVLLTSSSAPLGMNSGKQETKQHTLSNGTTSTCNPFD